MNGVVIFLLFVIYLLFLWLIIVGMLFFDKCNECKDWKYQAMRYQKMRDEIVFDEIAFEDRRNLWMTGMPPSEAFKQPEEDQFSVKDKKQL